jgi:hypothetical protein
MITVVSACYGGYDQPIAPLEQDVPVRWVMVTDGLVEVPEPWEVIVEPRPHLHPRMAAKIPKCMPYIYAGTHGYMADVMWLDASARILRPDFVSMCVDVLRDGGQVAQWVHPQRDCILDEAFVSSGMAKYDGQPVHPQAAYYIKNGHPQNVGLWATGCMVWRRPFLVRGVGQEWLTEQMLWTYQDQISWPVIVGQRGVKISPLPGGLWDRTYLEFRGHASDR